MARIKLQMFSGEVPKMASHLLNDAQAQETVNAKIDGGMLEAWNANSVEENSTVISPLSLYKYIQDNGATEDWYVSDEDLDFVDNPQSADTYERVFFAGAINDDYYTDEMAGEQGLAVESYDPSTGIVTFTAAQGDSDFAIGDYIRDTVTLIEYKITAIDLTLTATNDYAVIEDGPQALSATVDIMEILYTAPNYGEKEIRFFANDMDVAVAWDGSIHYGVLGVQPPEGELDAWVDTGSGAGRVDSPNPDDYSYVYTYVNSYGEEGPPSSPTSVVSIPTTDKVYLQFKPPYAVGDNESLMPDDWHYDITHINVYRTSSGVTSTDFLFVKQLTISSIENNLISATGVDSYVAATGVLTMTADHAVNAFDPAKLHYVKDLDNDRYYRITAVSLGGGAGADTITIADAKPNIMSATVDIVEWITEDDILTEDLGDPVASENYYPPIIGLDGMTSMASGHLYAWKDNVLYYSYPYLPHAWKTTDVISISQQIIVARGFANTLCIGTDGFPYVFSGQSPRTFNKIKMGEWLPCTSKRSTVLVNNAILYPTREGLIQLSVSGTKNLTRKMIKREQWVSYGLDNAFAMWRNNRYYAFPANTVKPGFILDYIDGTFLSLSNYAECGYITPDEGVMYFVSVDASEGAAGTRRSIKQWQGDPLNNFAYTWKSKKIILPRNVNMGVARIELDDDFYGDLLQLIEDDEYLQGLNTDLFMQTYVVNLTDDSYLEATGVDSYVDPTLTLTPAVAADSIIPGTHRVEDPVTGKSYPIASVSLGNGAGSETITIDTVSGAGGEDSPPATFASTVNVLIPKDLQGAINGGNVVTREGRTEDRHTINGDILYDLNSVTASPYVTITIWADGVVVFTKSVDSAKAFKLPRGFKAKRWEVQFSGSIPVRGFDMATTMKEILQ